MPHLGDSSAFSINLPIRRRNWEMAVLQSSRVLDSCISPCWFFGEGVGKGDKVASFCISQLLGFRILDCACAARHLRSINSFSSFTQCALRSPVPRGHHSNEFTLIRMARMDQGLTKTWMASLSRIYESHWPQNFQNLWYQNYLRFISICSG